MGDADDWRRVQNLKKNFRGHSLRLTAIFPDIPAMVILSGEFRRQLLATVDDVTPSNAEVDADTLAKRLAAVFKFQVRRVSWRRPGL